MGKKSGACVTSQIISLVLSALDLMHLNSALAGRQVVEQLWPFSTCTLVSTIPDPALILAKSTTMLRLFWHLCHCWSSPLRFFKSCFSNVVFEKINEYLVASRKIRHSISPNHIGVCCMPVENREDHIFGPTMASRLCLLSRECVVGRLFPAANCDV